MRSKASRFLGHGCPKPADAIALVSRLFLPGGGQEQYKNIWPSELSLKSSRSCRMRRNTMPPAPRRAGSGGIPATARGLALRGLGHLPRLCAGWPLHQPSEDPDDELLHLRLRLLHQPRLEPGGAGAFLGRGGRAPDGGVLSPQLYRRAVPVLGHHPLTRRYDGRHGADRQEAAARGRLSRLHSPQDHSRREPGADRRGGQICRPVVDQYRDADGDVAERTCARKERGGYPQVDGRCSPEARGEPHRQKLARQTARAVCACRAIDAGDRRGGHGQ